VPAIASIENATLPNARNTSATWPRAAYSGEYRRRITSAGFAAITSAIAIANITE